MDRLKLFDQGSIIALGTSFIITFSIVYSFSGMFFNSLFAAFIGAGFFWLTYITMRWLIRAVRK